MSRPLEDALNLRTSQRCFELVPRGYRQDKPTVKFLYLLVHPADSTWVKLGETTNPAKRLVVYQTASPWPLAFEKTWDVPAFVRDKDISGLVAAIADARNKEWFKVEKELALEILDCAVERVWEAWEREPVVDFERVTGGSDFKRIGRKYELSDLAFLDANQWQQADGFDTLSPELVDTVLLRFLRGENDCRDSAGLGC